MRWVSSLRGKSALSLVLFQALFLVSCGPQNNYQDEARKDNAHESQLRDQLLAPVLGTYCGSMALIKNGLPVKVFFDLERGDDNIHSTQSQDPTLTARVSKLEGSMHFPAMDLSKDPGNEFPDLYVAMGQQVALNFDNGDYNPDNQQINLPFNVPGHPQSGFGEVRGVFGGGNIAGTWYSIAFQKLGTFNVSRCAGSASK